jgi:hypothetical protein
MGKACSMEMRDAYRMLTGRPEGKRSLGRPSCPVVQRVRLALSKGPNRIGIYVASPEVGSRSSFRIVVFSSYL